ncbi:MAG: PKD domain-containing protein [Solirubrobacteraceae bacterium]
MTIFARSRSWLAGALSRHTPLLRVAVPLAALLTLSLLAATPAGAVVATVGETTVGLQPRTESLGEGEAASFANEAGNAVVHGAAVYVDYWDPAYKMRPEALSRMDIFFQQLEGDSLLLSNILANQSQYRDRTNTGAKYQDVFKASYSDTEKYPTTGNCTDPQPLTKGALSCLTDAQIRAHLQSFIALHALPKGMNSIYYVILPPGATVCVDQASTRCSDYHVTKVEEEKKEFPSYESSFCSYHSAINPDPAPAGDGNTVLYAAVPWSAGTLTDAFTRPNSGPFAKAVACQDGGWNPEKHKEVREVEKEMSKTEEKEFAEATLEKKEEITKKRQGEGPHQEEPSAENKGEFAGWALADLMANQIAEEQANLVTDPLLNAWHDKTGHESTDICRNNFAGTVGGEGRFGGELEGSAAINEETLAGTLANTKLGITDPENPAKPYYINNVYDSSQNSCVGGVSLVPSFTSPNPVKNNEAVAFDGMETNISLIQASSFGPTGLPVKTYSTYTWNFGDGSSVAGFAPGAPVCESPWIAPCAGSAFHTYAYGGTYHVTLTVTDVGGNTARVEHNVLVNGPLPPTPPPPSAPGSGNTGAHNGGTEGSGGGTPRPGPVASAAIVSRNLHAVARRGLVLRYAVNEQVTGHAELLISKALARKLKLSATPAAGLPAGMPPEVVIGKAVLVTTKAGKGTLTIRLSPSVAARLRKAHKAGVIVRLLVRNAASRTGASATVLSTATLG